MSLTIYQESGGGGAISQGGTYITPLTYEVSQEGGVQERRMYLRSDTPTTEAIVNAKLFARDATLPDESSWVSFAPDINGAAGTYTAQLEFNLALNQELPFWIKLDVPSGQPGDNKVDISLVTRYTKVAS